MFLWNNRNTNPFKYYIHWSFYFVMNVRRNVSYLENYYFLEGFLTMKLNSNLFYFPGPYYRLHCFETFSIMIVYKRISWFYRCFWCHQRSNPLFWIKKTFLAPCCFFLALSHMAGLIETGFPFLCIHLLEQTKTPKHDFFRMFTLWLLVFLIAHPEVCFLASSQLGE